MALWRERQCREQRNGVGTIDAMGSPLSWNYYIDFLLLVCLYDHNTLVMFNSISEKEERF